LNYAGMSTEELVSACAESNQAPAWEEFVRRFHRLIAGVAIRTASGWGEQSSQLIDELIQETYLKLCANEASLLRTFDSQHPDAFCGYLKVLTANLVHDYFRAQHSHKRGKGQLEMSIDEQDVIPSVTTIDGAASIERDVLLREIDDLLCSSLLETDRKRDRIIFWLHHRSGLTAHAIAQLPSVTLTVKGVESVIHRLTRAVREQLVLRRGNLSQIDGERHLP
jgi:RNA polymerase sigma-70 factor, ECF subfamily